MGNRAGIDLVKPTPMLKFISLCIKLLRKPLELKFRYVSSDVSGSLITTDWAV